VWALVQPLIQLAVYGAVFVYVFKASAPAGGVGFVPFLALGLWPWNAFAEALMRGTTAIPDNAGLIGKVALPREVLVVAAVSSSFLLHGVGYCHLQYTGWGVPVHLLALPLAFLTYLQLFVLALGFALTFAAIQVFVRDLSQVLVQVLQLWMFASPIFYAREFLPERFRGWLDFNPVTHYVETFRAILLDTGTVSLLDQGISLLVAIVALGIGFTVFRRLSPRFEDFL
jgi:lipopolysaccharide transport system permease protein